MDQTSMGNCRAIGVYEVLLQPNGNLKYVPIEDDCAGRIMDILGAGDKKNSIEWKPVY